MRWSRTGIVVLAVGLLALGFGSYMYVYWGPRTPPGTPQAEIGKIRYMLNDLRGSFAQGQAVKPPDSNAPPGGRQDARVEIVRLQLDRLRWIVATRMRDQAKRQAALTHVAEAKDYWDAFLPEYGKAVVSKNAQDAKALLSYVATMEQHMDAIAGRL